MLCKAPNPDEPNPKERPFWNQTLLYTCCCTCSCIVVNVVEVDLVVVDEIRPVNTDQQIAETLHDTEEDNPISVQMYVDQ